jgi:transglutaminase-like putative cysteine protease
VRKIGPTASGADFLLAGVASGLATFSSAMSVSQHTFAWMCLFGCVVLSWFARQANKRLGEASATIGPWVYVSSLLAITVATPWLNRLLPAGGYPIQALAAGWLTFMVLGGSLFAVTDGTLNFQIVPSIAIFGLVGAFDTYPYGSLLFFVFIALAASLFFRTHARSMLNQMELALSPQSRDGLRGKALAQRAIESGAWRWMAGPEWALGSALIIISLSVFGAPALRKTVRSVVGNSPITIMPPVNSSSTSNNFRQDQRDVEIGNGPVSQSDTPIFKIKFPGADYLRGRTADVFTGSGWQRAYNSRVQSRNLRMLPYVRVPSFGIAVEFELMFLAGRHDTVYVPGEAIRVSAPANAMSIRTDNQLNIEPDGTVKLDGQPDQVSGTVRVIPEPNPDQQARLSNLRTQQFFTSTDNTPESVARFAETVTRSATNDLDRAKALESAIGAQCNYNLKAAPIPKGENAVEYFLFNERQGYCDLFASSMAVCARAVGLPSRVAIGFVVRDPKEDEAGFVTLRESDYHMWAEVYFEDCGWVPFDPTKYASVVENNDAATSSVPWAIIGSVAGGLVSVVVVWQVVLSFYRGRPRTDVVAKQRNRVASMVIDFQRQISRATRRPRRLNETLGEYVGRVGPTLGAASESVEAMVPELENLLFAPNIEKDRIDSVATKLRELRTSIKNR